jgi:hypothetical protein
MFPPELSETVWKTDEKATFIRDGLSGHLKCSWKISITLKYLLFPTNGLSSLPELV